MIKPHLLAYTIFLKLSAHFFQIDNQVQVEVQHEHRGVSIACFVPACFVLEVLLFFYNNPHWHCGAGPIQHRVESEEVGRKKLASDPTAISPRARITLLSVSNLASTPCPNAQRYSNGQSLESKPSISVFLYYSQCATCIQIPLL